jgi:predicted ATPase/DNA-binding XRE family transcriptional regulator
MESPVTFGEWLRQSRNELRLTREEFAGRIGCSVSALRKIEGGERRPSVQIAGLMANCLSIPPNKRSTFVKVARGELSLERLPLVLKPTAGPGASPASRHPRTNLPVLPTPLIGRQRELLELVQLLHDPQCRLLTLTGPGGIGKTRLAIEVASQVQASQDFADGAYFVPLAAVNSPRFIVPVIADAIGFAFASASHAEPKAQLFNYLEGKQALLLLDNLEHLLAEPGGQQLAVLLAELLAHASQVKLLVTSLESLALQGEWVREVQGLPVPESRYMEGSAFGNALGSAQDTSVELFLQRARRADVGFLATPEDYPAIVRICQLVEGNPLGIELAAAWVRTLACEEIAQEIERGPGFLSMPTRDLPLRHRSMRAVFEHSWALLTGEEQAVLLQLSAFLGGFRREAAEQVAGAALSMLSALATKSLIRRSGAGRYDLHEMVRKFAAEQLAGRPGEQAATKARHGRYFLTYFSQADKRFASSAQPEAIAELTAEMDNFRLAWDWAVAHDEFALIEGTLRTFAMLDDIRRWLPDGLDCLDRAANALETSQARSPLDRTTQVALAHVLTCRALSAFRLTRDEGAQAMLERSLEILRPLDEPRVLVESVYVLGLVMVWKGDYTRALELLTEGRETAITIGDLQYSAMCLTQQANVSVMMGNHKNGHERLQSAVAEWRIIGDLRFTAYALNLLSLSALAQGRHDEARLALEESLALDTSIGDRWGLGSAYRGLGRVAQVQGQHEDAVDMYSKAIETFTELGARHDAARALAEMGRSVIALGYDAEAERVWRESFLIATQTHGAHVALEALVGLARLQAKRGDVQTALEWLLVVLNHPSSVQETRERAGQLRLELEAQLTSQQIEAANARAQAKTFEAVVEDVLKQI